MKVTKIKPTGRIFETQFGEHSEVLINNASQYYNKEDIQIVDMTMEQYKIEIEIQNENDMPEEQKIEAKIKKEQQLILRNQAIENLKDKGILDLEGNIIK